MKLLSVSCIADSDYSYVQNFKKSAREAALSKEYFNSEFSRDSPDVESSEHFFLPLSASGFSHLVPGSKGSSVRSKRLFAPQMASSLFESHASDGRIESKIKDSSEMLDGLGLHQAKGFLSVANSNGDLSFAQRSFYDLEEAENQVFSPSLLTDASLVEDSYEDLLGVRVALAPNHFNI